VTITFHALWMLCALGAVVYSAAAPPRVRDLTALAIGFALATIVASPQRLLEGRRGDAEDIARGVRRERESSWRVAFLVAWKYKRRRLR
jgi:hypothetical protein